MILATPQQARDHLRIDSMDDHEDLMGKIEAASALVLGYVHCSVWEPSRDEEGRPALDADGKEMPLTDADGAKVVRHVLRQATLLTIGFLYRERDGSNDHSAGHGFLPAGVIALLYPLRKPTAV